MILGLSVATVLIKSIALRERRLVQGDCSGMLLMSMKKSIFEHTKQIH